MELSDEFKKFADITEEIRKRAVKVSELKDQNRAYEQGNSELEGTKSHLLEEIKALKEEKRALSISRAKMRKAEEVDKRVLRDLGIDLNKIRTEKEKTLKEVQELQSTKAVLELENSDLVAENSAKKKETKDFVASMEESMRTLMDLQEQLDVKETLLRNREKKLDLREEALS